MMTSKYLVITKMETKIFIFTEMYLSTMRQIDRLWSC